MCRAWCCQSPIQVAVVCTEQCFCTIDSWLENSIHTEWHVGYVLTHYLLSCGVQRLCLSSLQPSKPAPPPSPPPPPLTVVVTLYSSLWGWGGGCCCCSSPSYAPSGIEEGLRKIRDTCVSKSNEKVWRHVADNDTSRHILHCLFNHEREESILFDDHWWKVQHHSHVYICVNAFRWW